MKFFMKNKMRWMIVVGDLFLSTMGLMLAYLMRFDWTDDFDQILQEWYIMSPIIGIYFLVKLTVYLAFKLQKHIIRHTSTQDILLVFLVNLLSSVVLLLIGGARYLFYDGYFLFPTVVLILEFLFSSMLMTICRFAIKLIYLETINKGANKKNILIYGAGTSGLMTKRTIEREELLSYNIVGFLDDNDKIKGVFLESVPVYHTSKIEDIVIQKNIKTIVLAIQKPVLSNQNKLIDFCFKHDIEILKVPPFSNWINGEFSPKQIKSIRIEDLLGRDEIHLNKDKIKEELCDRVVLVTGAAGSIGSGMVREIVRFKPQKVVLLDNAESAMYDFVNDLTSIFPSVPIEVVIANIRDASRMQTIFAQWKPNYVLHAAAYKHVPLMENNPGEAVATNIYGSKILVDLSIAYQVDKFVMISTDKAVNPTNVMGASKRIAEMYAQYMNKKSATQFITTRFGNVIGSNGSVIPLFRKQIERGGPLTVTHPEVTRYFMTIPEACQLVLEAGVIGKGGEVFVFDMGKSIKIIDIAKKMIKLSGLELDKDIEIKIVGLRPGEKLYEELLTDKEITLPTHHPKIMRAKMRPIIDQEIEQIETLAQPNSLAGDEHTIVVKMKEIVPEFKSMNSIYQQLDAFSVCITISSLLFALL